MRRVLKAKFEQNAQFLEALLSTGTRNIIQRDKNDSYWGDGHDGSGRNRLGILLMEVREELRREK